MFHKTTTIHTYMYITIVNVPCSLCNDLVHLTPLQGSTGVMTCSYLLHDGHYDTAEDALKFYDETRMVTGKVSSEIIIVNGL